MFERDDEIGGLLRYGIPNFKMEKEIIDRRVAILKAEGISFEVNVSELKMNIELFVQLYNSTKNLHST